MITILELAEELHASKSTINRKIKDLNLKGALEFTDGKYYLTDEQADEIRRTMKRTTPPREANHDKKETPPHEAHHDARRSASDDKRIINDLLAQLKAKDEQIKELHGIIEQHQVIIDQQQKLNLISQQRILALEDKQQKEEQKGFFARLFGKSRQQAQPQEEQQTNKEKSEEAEENQSKT